jgi:hypothetical protein
MIVLLSSEPRQVEDDDELDGALVLTAELEQLLSSVRSAVFALSPSSRKRASTWKP